LAQRRPAAARAEYPRQAGVSGLPHPFWSQGEGHEEDRDDGGLSALVTLAACNTVNGAGKDLSSAGSAVSGASGQKGKN
jgi:predicted small secreted protein